MAAKTQVGWNVARVLAWAVALGVIGAMPRESRGGAVAFEDGTGRSWRRLEGAGAEYSFRVAVSNDGPYPLTLTVTSTGAPAYRVVMPVEVKVPASGMATFGMTAAIPDAASRLLPPFSPDAIRLRFAAAPTPDRKRVPLHSLTLQVGTPGALTPPGAAWVAGVREYAASPAGKRLFAVASNAAEKVLATLDNPIDPPTEALWLAGPTNQPWHMLHWPRYVQVEILPSGGFRCPLCEQVWTPRALATGPERFTRYRAALEPLGQAAMLTGSERFARPAREILKALAAVYRSFPASRYKTRLGLNLMHECQFDSKATACLWRLQAAGLIPDADLAAIAGGFLIPSVDTLISTTGGTANQLALQACTVGEAGLVLNWPPYIAWALRDPQRGWMSLVGRFIGNDGGWLEGSLSYHMTAVQWVAPLPAVLQIYGHNLVTEDVAIGERLRKFFTFPSLAMRPDYRLASINDAGLGSPGNAWNAAAYALTRDPLLLPWASPDLIYPVPPAAKGVTAWESHNFPDFGAAVMHDHGATNQENWVLLDYGAHGGGHGHYDKLNVVCYAHGQPIHDDGGSIYSSPLQFSWLRNTVSHNTIIVDETAQEATTGQLDQWEHPASGPQIAVASTDAAYPGTRLERAVVLAAGAQVFLDAAVSTNRHVYDWVFTSYGTVTNTSFASRPRGPLPFEPLPYGFAESNIWYQSPGPRVGYDLPQNLHEGIVDGRWTIGWDGVRAPYSKNRPAIRMRWLGWTPTAARVVWGDIPGFMLATNGMRWVSIRQEGREAVWVTALVPGEGGVDDLKVDAAGEGKGFAIQLLQRGSNVCWIAWNRAPGEWLAAGPIRTRDRVAARQTGVMNTE
jgi:hypothetical protein